MNKLPVLITLRFLIWLGLSIIQPASWAASGWDIGRLASLHDQSPLLAEDFPKNRLLSLLRGKVEPLVCVGGESDGTSDDSEAWHLTQRSSDALTFQQCSTNSVKYIRAYPLEQRHELVVVAEENGESHQSWRFEFYKWRQPSSFVQIDKESTGLPVLRNNDFLNEHATKFPDESNDVAALYLMPDGTFVAEPFTWMSEVWMGREPDFRLRFRWQHGRFRSEVLRSDSNSK